MVHMKDNVVRFCSLIVVLSVVVFHAQGLGGIALDDLRVKKGRIDAVVGQMLMVPVEVGEVVPEPENIKVHMDDGQTVVVRLVWFGVLKDVGGAGVKRWNWLESTTWGSQEAEVATPIQGEGFWAVVANLPASAMGQGLWIDGKRHELNWLTDPALVQEQVSWTVDQQDMDHLADPVFEAMTRSQWEDPLRRWRMRLITTGRASAGWYTTVDDAQEVQPRIDDELVERWALLIEAKWQVGLDQLHEHDAALAQELGRVLTRKINFDGEHVVPIWPDDEGALGEVLGMLINQKRSLKWRGKRVRRWLDEQPGGAAWVVDDAGGVGNEGSRASTIEFMNLTDESVLGWVRSSTADSKAVVEPVEARRAVGIRVEHGEVGSAMGMTVAVDMASDDVPVILAVVGAPVAVEPPGLTMGPFVADWALGELVGGQQVGRMVVGDWASAARLYQTNTGWELFVEMRVPGDWMWEERSVHERLEVTLGAWGSPTHVIGVSSDQASTDRVRVGRTADGWAVRLKLPAGVVGREGLIVLGMVRVDGRKERSAWPRAMVPWEGEPGRVAIDPKAWD